MSNPWDRRDGESSTAYKCFSTFLHAGADRSLISAYRQETGRKAAGSISGHWGLWAAKFEWQERAVAFDNWGVQLELEERRRALRADESKWRARRDALREREFATAEELIARGRAILALPITEQHIVDAMEVDGESIPILTIINPVRGAIQSVAKILSLGTVLERHATDFDKHADDDEEKESTGAKVIRFPVAVASADEWSAQYKKKA